MNLSNSVLHRAKPEILRGVELLIDKMQNEMADLLVEVIIVNVSNNSYIHHYRPQHCHLLTVPYCSLFRDAVST